MLFYKNYLTYGFLIIYFNLIQFFDTKCYDNEQKPIKCSPDFVNIAYNLNVIASNTCGDPPSEFCTQTSSHHFDNTYSRSKVCDMCDSRFREKSHPVTYLTDYNSQSHTTWWQSDTMHEGIQYPNSVNLTLNFEKSFEITYIQLKFHSPRPESFALYKKTTETSDWIPYQYYSASCEETYGLSNRSSYIQRGNEAVALCTDEYSDIAPLTGASVAFSTLEGRPSAYSFDTSDELKEWVMATNVRIVLNRLNTFGDEVFKDASVLKSYFYAISDISIGGRCKCNGHASSCIMKQGENFDEKLKCDCEHNTDGTDCEKCLPFYNDVPWAAATWTDPHECRPCDCNGMSNKCFFDRDLYDQTGHGGHCIDCQRNTAGVNCQHCKESFYRSEHDNECIDCQCHPLGSENMQCDPSGKCRCKPGVVGAKCDRCDANFFDLTVDGCKPCNCSFIGSFDLPPICDSRDGKCRCKANVEGKKCDRCKPGFFDLDANNLLGCLTCFCNSHTSECQTADNHFKSQIVSHFESGTDAWSAVDAGNDNTDMQNDKHANSVFVLSNNKDVWFSAPSKYLGNQRKSYNQEITFELKFSKNYAKSTRKDVILENSQYGLKVYKQLNYDNFNQTDNFQMFSVRLKETDNWIPSISAKDFQRLLSNLTALRIRAPLSPSEHTQLRKFVLQTAEPFDKPMSGDFDRATWIEQCTCPNGYQGQFCENCMTGYRRETLNGDASVRCVPCSCNNHSTICDQQTGKCECMHNTMGDQCENCLDSYYGNALVGSSGDCKKCNCPNDGPCAEVLNYQSNTVEVVCLNCPEGTQGNSCELCEDGFFVNSTTRKCQRCTCNGNIDENAIGNCDTIDGRCLRCMYNTTGKSCEKCAHGYWGNALTSLKCHACDCFKAGTSVDDLQCALNDGQCKCKPHVIGRQCDQCEESYWNITSGKGCAECKCDPLGSYNLTCSSRSGQCFCKPGVIGLRCDKCATNHFDFSDMGCKRCNCDEFGSESLQCDDFGRCKCKPNILGMKCNKCEENRYNFTRGCLKCEDCYTLVEREVYSLRGKAKDISLALNDRTSQQNQVARKTNDNLSGKLQNLKNLVNQMHKTFYDGPENINYTESVRSLSENLKSLNNEYKSKERDYENHRKQFEDLERLNSIIGNAELELSGVKLILDNAEVRIKEKATAQPLTTEKSRIQILAQVARDASEQNTKVADDYARQFGILIESLKAIISRISFVPERLKNANQVISSKSYQASLEFPDERILALTDDIVMAKEKLRIKSDTTKMLLDRLQSTTVYNPSHDVDVVSIESFAASINDKGASLKTQIDMLSKKINKFVTLDIANATSFSRNIMKSVQLKQEEYKNLYDSVEKNKNLADESIKSVADILENLSETSKTLANFDDVYAQSKANAQQAELGLANTNENIEKINLLLQHLKSNMQQIYADVENVRSKNNILANSMEKLNGKFNNTKDEINRLKDDSNVLAKNTDNLSEMFKAIESKFNENTMLHKVHPSVIENQHKKAENLITNSQGLNNKISMALDNLNNLDESDFAFKNLKNDAIKRLQSKYEIFLKEVEAKLKYDEEINDLEKRNEKLSIKLNDLETIVPVLNERIANLDEINRSLVSNKCFSKSRFLLEDSELKNI